MARVLIAVLCVVPYDIPAIGGWPLCKTTLSGCLDDRHGDPAKAAATPPQRHAAE
jgi:hypothetical protein